MILIDNWEWVKFHYKTPYVLDAFGFLGPASYYYVLSSIERSFHITKKQLLLFLPGVMELMIQIIRIVDYTFLKAFLIPDHLYALFLEILEVGAFGMAISLCILLKMYLKKKSKTQSIPAEITFFFKINVLIVTAWGLTAWNFLQIFNIDSLSWIDIVAIAMLAFVIINFVSKYIRDPEFLSRLLSVNKRKEIVDEHPFAQRDVVRILTAIERGKLYKDPEFNLRQLSLAAGLPKDHTSALLNHKIGKSFRTLINEYRVEEAKRLLRNGTHDHLSMLGIAFEVGFKSESTFYQVFKKFTHTTPKAFKKNYSENAF